MYVLPLLSLYIPCLGKGKPYNIRLEKHFAWEPVSVATVESTSPQELAKYNDNIGREMTYVLLGRAE